MINSKEKVVKISFTHHFHGGKGAKGNLNLKHRLKETRLFI